VVRCFSVVALQIPTLNLSLSTGRFGGVCGVGGARRRRSRNYGDGVGLTTTRAPPEAKLPSK
jgi:hypothetical protein